MTDGKHPEPPAKMEQAWRAAHRALERAIPPATRASYRFVPEAEMDWTEVLEQFDLIVREARYALDATMGPVIVWTSGWAEDADDDDNAFALRFEAVDFDREAEDTLGWLEGRSSDYSPFEAAGRAYRRECRWDFAPGEAGIWLYAVAPYRFMGGETDSGWSGRIVAFAVLQDRDDDGAYESLAHVWTASGWRRRGIASQLIALARQQYGCSREEGPFTEAGSALLESLTTAQVAAPLLPPRIPFRQWLRQFATQKSAIGELARDAARDCDWPRGPGSLKRYETYLIKNRVQAMLDEELASPALLRTLRKAWARYEQDRTCARPKKVQR